MVIIITPQRGGNEIDREFKSRREKWEKEYKVQRLRIERGCYSDDPAQQAEIDREIAEIEASN